jgi:DNA repair exonuclease SbcCD ATPase subunit
VARSGSDFVREIRLEISDFSETMADINNIETAFRSAGDAAEGAASDLARAGESAEQVQSAFAQVESAAQEVESSVDNLTSIHAQTFKTDITEAREEMAAMKRDAENLQSVQRAMQNPMRSGQSMVELEPMRGREGQQVRRRNVTRAQAVGGLKESQRRLNRIESQFDKIRQKVLRGNMGLEAPLAEMSKLQAAAAGLEAPIDKAASAAGGLGSATEEVADGTQQASILFERLQKQVQDARTDLQKMSDPPEELQQEVAEAEARMLSLAASSDTTVEEIAQMERGMQDVTSRTAQARNNMRNMKGAASNSRQTAMALGNIMSDLPHGPAAVANNIGNAVEGMQEMNVSGRSFTKIIGGLMGPALLGGVITGVATLAANWDRVREKIKTAQQWMSGMREQTRKFRKEVRKMSEEMPSNFASTLIDEEGEEATQKVLDRFERQRKRAEAVAAAFGGEVTGGQLGRSVQGIFRQAQRDNFTPFNINSSNKEERKLAQERQEMINEMSLPEFRELAQQLEQGGLKQLNKTIKELRLALGEGDQQAVNNLRQSLSNAGVSGINTRADTPASRALQSLFEGGEDDSDSGGGSGDGETEDEAISPVGMAAGLPTVRDAEPIMPEAGVGETEEVLEAINQSISESARAFLDNQLQSIKQNLENEQAQLALEGTKRRGNVLRSTSPGIERQRQLAQVQRDTGMQRVNTRLESLRERRDTLERSPASTEQEMMAVNAAIDRALAERRKIRQKHLKRKAQLQKKEENQEDQHRKEQLQRFQSFSKSFNKIGSSVTDLFQQWRKQRVAELKRQGKSQKQIQKQIREEGKSHFQVMKAIRIAGAVANTISAGVTAYNQAQAATGPFGTAAAVAEMVAAIGAGMAQVQKLRQLKIGGGVPGGGASAGGGGSSQFTRLGSAQRDARVRNFAEEMNRDQALSRGESQAKAIREEHSKTRKKLDESRAIGDEESFDSNEAATDYEQKAIS